MLALLSFVGPTKVGRVVSPATWYPMTLTIGTTLYDDLYELLQLGLRITNCSVHVPLVLSIAIAVVVYNSS